MTNLCLLQMVFQRLEGRALRRLLEEYQKVMTGHMRHEQTWRIPESEHNQPQNKQPKSHSVMRHTDPQTQAHCQQRKRPTQQGEDEEGPPALNVTQP